MNFPPLYEKRLKEHDAPLNVADVYVLAALYSLAIAFYAVFFGLLFR